MSVAQIAGLAFTSEDRARDVLHNFNADGFESLYPRYAGGRPPVFTLAERREIKKIAKSKPAEYGLPFSRWSLAKLADFLVAEGVVEDTSHEGLRGTAARGERLVSGREDLEGVRRPGLAAKKARVDHMYAIADGEAAAGPGDPERGLMRGRIRAAEPTAPPEPAVGPPRRRRPRAGRGAAAADPGDLPPHQRDAAPVRRPEAGHRHDVRAH